MVPFWDHVSLLRRSVLQILGAVFVAGGIVHYFYRDIVGVLFSPLGSDYAALQFLTPLDPLMFILKIDLMGGVILASPIIVFILLRYVAPALPRHTTTVVALPIVVSFSLSVLALLYAYELVLPLILTFLGSLSVPGTVSAITAHSYLDFFLTTVLLFIVVFQTPLLMVLFTIVGVFNPRMIGGQRKKIYLGVLVLLAFITPTTDIFSLALVAIPTLFMFEGGLVACRIVIYFKNSTT